MSTLERGTILIKQSYQNPERKSCIALLNFKVLVFQLTSILGIFQSLENDKFG